MALLGAVDKSAALIELNNRIMRIAEEMGGNPSRIAVTRSLPSPMVAGASGEDVPALHVKMPDGFRVELAPTHPLSIWGALAVKATRTHRESRKND